MPSPASPTPNSASVPGSGTVAGAPMGVIVTYPLSGFASADASTKVPVSSDPPPPPYVMFP